MARENLIDFRSDAVWLIGFGNFRRFSSKNERFVPITLCVHPDPFEWRRWLSKRRIAPCALRKAVHAFLAVERIRSHRSVLPLTSRQVAGTRRTGGWVQKAAEWQFQFECTLVCRPKPHRCVCTANAVLRRYRYSHLPFASLALHFHFF